METWDDVAFAAYLGAFIDGEGHLQILPGQYSQPRIRIVNTDKRTLDAIQLRLGVGQVKEYDHSANKLGRKKIYDLEICRVEDVLYTLRLCGEYIFMKHERAKELIEAGHRTLERRSQRDHERQGLIRSVIAGLSEGKSQRQLAEELGVSQGLVSNINLGKMQYVRHD